ncbi:hypothetical protein SEA_ALTADENA_66 [Arthrobacter phage Altadena]|uniref:Uncharacterized protein n=1 Tax=Arthrobacter phage Altadena TaxID=3059064 RepID=A0AA96HWF8_9CAUD|nr:hypothetical protein SEA_ALTADENA_66 [Arthrobacter phage Altadena]
MVRRKSTLSSVLLASECGGAFPISGDAIARGAYDLAGLVDWAAEALEPEEDA